MNFKAPMVYFGGKSKIASTVWEYLGDVPNYVEPFFGSGAVLLCRPNWSTDVSWIETVNDKDGYVSNFWRAVQSDPDGVAHYADWPVIESDMHARHAWLVGQRESLVARLEGDLDYYDVKIG
jgi:DNA adenine methylase